VDLFALLLLTGSFALLVTVHVALVFGLIAKRPRWWAPIALVVPPLAPYLGFRSALRVRSTLWLVALALYLLGLAWARFGHFR
jgi:hypothetical protein